MLFFIWKVIDKMIKIKKNIKKIVAILMLVMIIISSSNLSVFASYITDINSNANFGVIAGSLSTYRT